MPDIKEALNAAYDEGDIAIENDPIDTQAQYQDEFSDDLDTPSSSAPKSIEKETSQTKSSSRDERGRFLPKGGNEVTQEATMTEEENGLDNQEIEDEAPEKEIPKIPSGFSKHRDLWEKLHDPNAPFTNEDKQSVLSFYKQRESEMLKGMGEYKDIAQKSHYLHKAIEPYIPRLLQEGIDPATHIRNLSEAHVKLSTGSPEEKLEIFRFLAQSYGIAFDPQARQMAPMDALSQQMMDQLRGMQSRFSQLDEERLQIQTERIQSEIEALQSDATNFPLFEEAREAMANLLESGQAKTFEEAYRKAIRLDDTLWEQEQARKLVQQVPRSVTNHAHIQKAKQAAVSVRSQAPVGKPAEVIPGASRSSNDRNSIKDALARAFG